MLKKSTLVVICSFCCILSYGQIKKGTLTTNLNIGDLRWLNLSKENKNFAINPGIGYFINDNWEVGVSFNYQRFRMVYHFSGANLLQEGKSVGIDIYSNYYFGKGKLKPYLTGRFGWQQDEWDLTNPTTTTTTHYNNQYLKLNIGGGINWQIRPGIALFTEGSFRKLYSFTDSRRPRSTPYLTIGVRFFFGD